MKNTESTQIDLLTEVTGVFHAIHNKQTSYLTCNHGILTVVNIILGTYLWDDDLKYCIYSWQRSL